MILTCPDLPLSFSLREAAEAARSSLLEAAEAACSASAPDLSVASHVSRPSSVETNACQYTTEERYSRGEVVCNYSAPEGVQI